MGSTLKIQEEIKTALLDALEKAGKEGKLNYNEIPNFVIEVPREKSHGDYATNLAMLMAKQAKMPPREVATILMEYFNKEETQVEEMEIAGPGFINFTLGNDWLYEVLPRVCREDEEYGCSTYGKKEKVQVEFVSANPTGLLHMGNARGAALGDTIANLLQAAGYDVTREFYINDAGNQIDLFGKSLEAKYLQSFDRDATLPEDGYQGQDITETVENFIAEYGDKYLDTAENVRLESLIQFALNEKLTHIRKNLESIRVNFDVWFSEQELHDNKEIESTLEVLKENGYIYEEDDALWLELSKLGEDYKDEVLVRSNGIPTYFAADIAYHKNKFDRGFEQVINVWGADHHGHIARMKGAMEALGYDPHKLTIVIMQLVRLFQSGELLRMSKRTGTYVTLRELVHEVGVDAVRYFFIMRSSDSHLDFDLDLAKSQSQDNPVFYVQYAHARICSIFRQVEELGHEVPDYRNVDLKLLKEDAELRLMNKIADLPAVVEGAAKSLEPHRLTRYASELASAFHGFYTECRVINDDRELMEARLVLAMAVRITLRNVLKLIGVEAPASM